MGQLTPGIVSNQITIGNIQVPLNYKGNTLQILVSRVTGAASYSPFRPLGSAVNYVVPGGKSFKVLAVKGFEVFGTLARIGVGYADTAGTWAGGAAPTTPIFSIGGAATVRYNMEVPANSTNELAMIGFNVPTGKYPFAYSDPTGCDATIYMIGYEE